MTQLIAAMAALVGGGLVALVVSRSPRLASGVGALSALAGCALGLVYAVRSLWAGTAAAFAHRWEVPYGSIEIGTDALSAFFLVPIFALGALTAPFGAAYMDAQRHRKSLGPAWCAFNLLLASMTLVVVARQAVLFLVAWEVMSLSAFACVTFDQEDAEVARAGWVYLIASHVGTAVLVALFLVLGRQAHGFDFDALGRSSPSHAVSGLIAALAIAGFGVKAGLVPLHVWLPEAHAAAPSHVSALMSGVLIKMGLYGILRIALLLGTPPAWQGPTLMGIGMAGATMGIALASTQRDIKRALAYSSIENMGIITIGIGLAFWGRASGRPHVAALGATAALMHVWNHASMKGLMFLGAGSVLHACETKDLERLGGVMKRMPRTGALMMLGGVAIAGLPPLNGFVSEWLLYLALMYGALGSAGAVSVLLMLAVGALSLVGAVAGLGFVRLLGVSLLGEPRSESAARCHESPSLMVVPIGVLAAVCIGIGLFPRPLAVGLSAVVHDLAGAGGGASALVGAPVETLAKCNAAVWGLVALGWGTAIVVLKGKRSLPDATWGCGYAAPSPRMQYSARSFSQMLADWLMPKSLRPVTSVSEPRGLFPASAELESDCRDPMTRGFYEPLLERWAERFAKLRWFQRGVTHVYLVYILVALLVGLAWSTLASWGGK